MSFLNIIPKTETYLDWNVEAVELRVVKSKGLEFTPDINIKVNDLSHGQKQYLNFSGDGDKFNIDVLLHEDDVIRGHPADNPNEVVYVQLIEALDYWIRNMFVILVTCDDAVDIPNGEYIITKNSKRKQNYRDGYTLWDLEFTRYTGVLMGMFVNVTTNVDKAIENYKKSKTTTTTTTTKTTTTKTTTNATATKLKKCNTDILKYSKTKKVYDCVKYLQEILKKLGYYSGTIDGWYGQLTVDAVKKFQKNYKKKNLLVDGWCGPVTLECIVASA